MQTRCLSLQGAGRQAALLEAAELIKGGQLVAFPTETVYGLGASALDSPAVARIFEAKGRPQDNPLIVHVDGLAMAKTLTNDWTSTAELLATAFWPGPLSLVVGAHPTVPQEVTAGLDSVALRMPDHEAARALIALCGPIAAPSANVSGRPSPVSAAHVLDDLGGRIPLVLDGGVCAIGVESTVVDVRGEIPVVLRPGGVTVEQIASLCGGCEVAPGVFEPVTAQALSPGMMHRHYAPRGRATVVPAGAGMVETLRGQMEKAQQEGEKPVCLCSAQIARQLAPYPCLVLDQEGEMSTGLFAALREADRQGYTRLFLQGTDYEGLGMAYMNRALRAAGFDSGEGAL